MPATKMYTEYALIEINEICERKSISVLNKLPEVNGPQLVTSLIKPLVNVIQNKNNRHHEVADSCLQDDKDVLWIMEVIGYGLSLPLADNEQYEAVRDCVNIYCEWLQALSPSLAQDKFIPNPIRENPNLYCQKIIGHLYNTFLPRKSYNHTETVNDLISKQALICHRILRLLIDRIASEKDNVINAKTWECLLIFLLGINERLLKSPTDTNDIGTQIADRVISTLFQGWLLSCVYFFPAPSFWRTFQNICIDLRHRAPLVAQWNRVNVCLTRRLVSLLYGHESPVPVDNKLNFSQYNNTVMLLNETVLKQCWYRFLHIIGNPVDLCFPKLIYKTDVLLNTGTPDGTLIHNLPFIFHKAIKGLCTLVDIFLGIPNINLADIEYDIPKFAVSATNSHTPPEKRKPNFPTLVKGGGEKSQTTAGSSNRSSVHHVFKNNLEQHHFPNIVLPQLPGTFYQKHIKLTSILDVFGKWLFQASFIGVPAKPKELLEKSLYSNVDQSSAQKFDPNHLPAETDGDIPLDLFDAGQAEALGALCRIFCLKKDDEDVSLILNKQTHPDFQKLKTYLTSFYLALKCNLTVTGETFKIQILSSILVNSVHFFEVDLPGSKILVPHFLRAIEMFLVRRDKSDTACYVQIRRACIKTLVSLLSFPLHYKNLPIKDSLAEKSSPTFISFFPKLFLSLICGLYNETDQTNVQMILNAFLFIMEDCVHFQTETSTEPGPSSFNLFELFNQTDFQIFNDVHVEKLGTNMFLLITSFVSDILRRSSLKNSNYSISLTAIEILLALGRIKYRQQQLCNKKCSMCIEQICRFIENQCNKPAPAHSRDMHSTIVAAYQCLAIWINEHQHLTMDKACISMLFEIIELGISGSKSNKKTDDGNNDGQQRSFKSEKILKPTSLRVREAAELLLTTLLNRMEMNVSAGETIIPCHLNESKIAELLFGIKGSSEASFNQFRYFIVENSLMISVLDKQICHGETVCLIRSAYGKYCWIMKNQPVASRHLLNHQNEGVSFYRSLNKPEIHHRNVTYNYFPECHDRVNAGTNKYENQIPSVTRYINENQEIKQEFETVLGYIDTAEKRLAEEKARLTTVLPKKDLSEPAPSRMFEAYRLILSQFENFNFNFKNGNSSGLAILNNQSQTFMEHVAKLDMVSSKINDMVMVFYVPKEFVHQDEIFMMNHHQYMTNPTFKYFLNSLGNPIPCETKICSNIFYWNDILHELIFLCPNKLKKRLDDVHLETFVRESNEHIRNVLLEKIPVDISDPNDKIKEFLFGNQGCDVKLFVLWLEKMEDLERLPFNIFANTGSSQDSQETETEPYYIIVIHPLRNGLFRVLNYFSMSKFNLPIIDRMLLSKHLLAVHVKLTALSLFRKRRMIIESFQLPHVKRRHKIQEMVSKFKSSTLTNQKLVSEIFKSKFL